MLHYCLAWWKGGGDLICIFSWWLPLDNNFRRREEFHVNILEKQSYKQDKTNYYILSVANEMKVNRIKVKDITSIREAPGKKLDQGTWLMPDPYIQALLLLLLQLLLNCYWFFMNCYWIATELLENCLRIDRELLLNCYWISTELLLNCYWIATELQLNYYWIATELQLNCYWIATELLLNCYWIPTEFLLTCYWISTHLLVNCY